jgi:hypothetical protein
VSFTNKKSRAGRNTRSSSGARVPRADQLGYYSPTSQKILQASKESYRTWLAISEPFPSPDARNDRSYDAYEDSAAALGTEGDVLRSYICLMHESQSYMSPCRSPCGRITAKSCALHLYLSIQLRYSPLSL